mmetsp:Transcript_22930/g.47573  ORF Transcript_22930/g.47573 Transcript_22930/m.47573 type:complete len:377 (-) Transcript_22930:2577-3707(-)
MPIMATPAASQQPRSLVARRLSHGETDANDPGTDLHRDTLDTLGRFGKPLGDRRTRIKPVVGLGCAGRLGLSGGFRRLGLGRRSFGRFRLCRSWSRRRSRRRSHFRRSSLLRRSWSRRLHRSWSRRLRRRRSGLLCRSWSCRRRRSSPARLEVHYLHRLGSGGGGSGHRRPFFGRNLGAGAWQRELLRWTARSRRIVVLLQAGLLEHKGYGPVLRVLFHLVVEQAVLLDHLPCAHPLALFFLDPSVHLVVLIDVLSPDRKAHAPVEGAQAALNVLLWQRLARRRHVGLAVFSLPRVELEGRTLLRGAPVPVQLGQPRHHLGDGQLGCNALEPDPNENPLRDRDERTADGLDYRNQRNVRAQQEHEREHVSTGEITL